MKKKILLIPLALLVISLVATGCAKPAPAPAPAPAPEAIKWRMDTFYSAPGNPWTDVMPPFCEAVKERTNGGLDIHLYWAGELGVWGKDYLPALKGQAIHLGNASTAYYVHEIEGCAISAMPMIVKDLAESKKFLEGLRPFIDKQLKEKYNVKVLCMVPWELVQLVSAKKVDDVTNLNGLKLRCPQPLTAQVLKNCNGVPVSMPMGEVYMGIQKGVVDGYISTLDSLESEKFLEVINYVYLVGYHGAAYIWLMSLDAFNELPEDIQKIVSEEAKKAEDTALASVSKELETYSKIAKQHGIEVISPTAAEIEAVRASAKPIWDEWYRGASAEGRQEFYNALARIGVTYTP